MNNENQIRDAYEILECKPGCSAEEVKITYRQLVKVWHPDRFDSDPKLKSKATEKLKTINSAYQLVIAVLEKKQIPSQASQNATGATRTESTEHGSKQASPQKAEFGRREEKVAFKERRHWKSGQPFFEKLVTVDDFNGVAFTQRIVVYRTKLMRAGDTFGDAATDSESFLLRPEDGVKSKVVPEGCEENPGVYDTLYSFPDGSEIQVHESSSWSIVSSSQNLKWSGRRSALKEIIEDFVFFERQQDWKQCILFAQKAVDLHRNSLWGWIHRSQALHQFSMPKAALHGLRKALEQFPKEVSIHYTSARYCSQLRMNQESIKFIKTAFELARSQGCFDKYHAMALSDSDLAPIRSAIPQAAMFSAISRFF